MDSAIIHTLIDPINDQKDVLATSSIPIANKTTEAYPTSSAVGSRPPAKSADNNTAPPPAIHYTMTVPVIEPLHIESAKGMEESFRDLQPYFEGKESDQNWSHREASVLKLRRITRGNAPHTFTTAYLAGIRGLLDGILKTVNSLRTTLSATGCYLVQDIAAAAGPGLDNMVEILLQSLIKLCAATKKISSQNGDTTVNSIFANVSFTPRLVQHIWNASQDKNVQPRTFAAGWLKTIIDTHGHHKHVLEHGGSLEIIEKTIRKGLNDANPGVRGNMRSAFWAFASISTERSESIMLALDTKQQSQLVDDPSNPNPGKTIASTSTATGKAGETSQSTKSAPAQPSLKETIAAKKRAKEAESQIPRRSSIEQTSLPAKAPTIHPTTAISTISKATGTKATDTKTTCTKAIGTMSSAPVRPFRPGRKATNADSTKKGPDAGSSLAIPVAALPKKSNALARPTRSVSSKPVSKTPSRLSSSHSNKTINGPTGSSSENDASAKESNTLAQPTKSVSKKLVTKKPSKMSLLNSNKTSNGPTGSPPENDGDMTYRPSVQEVPFQSILPVDLDKVDILPSETHFGLRTPMTPLEASVNWKENYNLEDLLKESYTMEDLLKESPKPTRAYLDHVSWKENYAVNALEQSPKTVQAFLDHWEAFGQITSPMRLDYPKRLAQAHSNAPGLDSPAKQLDWRTYEAEERGHSLWVEDVSYPLADKELQQNLIPRLKARNLKLSGFRELQDIIRNHRAICGLPTTIRSIVLPLVDWLIMTDDVRISSSIVLMLRMMIDYHPSALIPYHASVIRSVLNARKHYASTDFVIYGMSQLTEQIVEACDPETLLGEVVSMLQATQEPEAIDTVVMGLSVAAKLVHRLKQITSKDIIERTGSYAVSCVSDNQPTEIRESGMKLATELSVWVTEEAFWKMFAGVRGGTKDLLKYYVEKLKRELQDG